MKNTALLILFFIFIINGYSQVTRGSINGEFYIATAWFADEEAPRNGIFRSPDNGEHLYVQYSSLDLPFPGEMRIREIVSDSTEGVLYNYSYTPNELWRSIDYGENWEMIMDSAPIGSFTSGNMHGQIYRSRAGTIWKSSDYGNTFNVINIDARGMLEVGFASNMLFGLDIADDGVYLLLISDDFGESFSTIPIDTTVARYAIEGHHPEISRGATEGELYLVSWWPNYHFKIFYSQDYGTTWTEQYESEFIDFWDWAVEYTAGREPCSFYVFRKTMSPDFTHRQLYIDYSADCGQTFTTYYHDLTPDYTNIKNHVDIEEKLIIYPNPAFEEIKLSFENTENNFQLDLRITSVLDQQVYETTLIKGQEELSIQLNKWQQGVYLVQVYSNGKLVGNNRFIKM